MPKVAVLMGSKSDYSVVKPCVDTLKAFGIDAVVRVISAHRTPDIAHEFASNAKADGIEVIICAAGKAAHLAGVIASFTTLPVIGLPVLGSAFSGMDSLLSMVQMPAGIPVATVAVNGAENAALLSAQILALKYTGLADKLTAHRCVMRDKNIADDTELQGLVQ